VEGLCHVLPGTAPADIAAGINQLLKNPPLLDSRREVRQAWLKTHSWKTLAGRLDAMIQELARNDLKKAGSDLQLEEQRIA
jgi:glycosyltransferase involved in cell wall biosynthesis